MLLLLTHPMGVPSGGTAIKYRPGLSAALRAHGSEPLRHMAEHSVRTLLSCLGPMHKGTLEGGAAFGVRVTIDYWLIGPLVIGRSGPA